MKHIRLYNLVLSFFLQMLKLTKAHVLVRYKNMFKTKFIFQKITILKTPKKYAYLYEIYIENKMLNKANNDYVCEIMYKVDKR